MRCQRAGRGCSGPSPAPSWCSWTGRGPACFGKGAGSPAQERSTGRPVAWRNVFSCQLVGCQLSEMHSLTARAFFPPALGVSLQELIRLPGKKPGARLSFVGGGPTHLKTTTNSAFHRLLACLRDVSWGYHLELYRITLGGYHLMLRVL